MTAILHLRSPILGSSLLLLLLTPLTTFGQWRTQNIPLRPGWNAVFLEVQPEPRECTTIFESLPIESVWGWNRRFSSVQFIDDPRDLVPGQPDWLAFFPPSHPLSSENNLHILQAGKPYLIQVHSSAAPFNWTVTGVPGSRAISWLSDSLNFVGFNLDPASPPTFQTFFQPSAAHTNQPIYRLTSQGTWQTTPPGSRMTHGEAFWIYTQGQSRFAGPTEVIFEQGRGMDYGRTLIEQTLRIKNNSTNARTFVLKQAASGAPPLMPQYPVLAGPVPLSYWHMDLAAPTNIGWIRLESSLTNTVPPGGEWALRLAVRRTDMAPLTVPFMGDYTYQSLLTVANGAGSFQVIPVTALGLQAVPAQSAQGNGGVFALNTEPDPHPHAGLWVGHTVITNVSQPSSSNPDLPLPTASEFQFRLIVHVDNAGQARLLQKVLLLWTNGTYRVGDLGYLEVERPGGYVLTTDKDRLPPNLYGLQFVGRRISSTAFGFREPKRLGDGFGVATLTTDVTIDYDDPLNPYKHKYHPDHDNLDTDFTSKLTSQVESFTINRHIEMQFTSTDPWDLRLPGWGEDQVGGLYREEISGLHKRTNYISGTFRLHRALPVGLLYE